ncbi:RHS repeat-associated core domain-containing protein, partial [Bacteroides pyogenes]|uniref:RHS repeat-associated core domain-containing protein n=1 Tax=Bacteroides pyogenes TaxID=310300 RepID=UPI002A7F27BE
KLDMYGSVRTFAGRSLNDCPFRYQGQYFDEETDLCYNRFRYYSPNEGMYISQDPIGLAGGLNFYAYVHDSNLWIDALGLTGTYIFTDGTTSYIGKGPKSRMNTSMNQRIGGCSNATASIHVDFGDDDMGFMVEHKLMEDYNARFSEDFANSDKISSPGKKKYEAADAKTRAKVDAEAERIKADFESQKAIVDFH